MTPRSTYILCFLVLVAVARADNYEPDNNASTATWLAANTQQTHNFSNTADIDYYQFNVTKGTVYLLETFNQTPQATTDTIADVLFPNDVLLVTNDDDLRFATTNSRITFQAPSTGTYLARVTEYNDLAGGIYAIRFTQLGTLNTTITPNTSINTTTNTTFTVTATTTCTGGPCGTVKLTLDPKEEEPLIDPLVRKELAQEGTADVLITYKKTKTKNSVAAQRILAQAADAENIHAYERIPVVAATLTEADVEALSIDPSVTYIGLNREVHIALPSSTPSIGAPSVWQTQINNTNITGTGVTVCVIDTGIMYTHSDFGACNATSDINDGSCPSIIGGVNYCSDEACTVTNYNPLDNNGHGSHVAGTIISQDATYTGVAPGAKVVAMKALNSAGSGYLDDVVAAMDWCIANATTYNISIISMSLGADVLHDNCDRDAAAAAVQAAHDAGILVTVAAGNEFTLEPWLGISTPGCISNATSVGATDDATTYATFSKRDITLDVLAPGVSITATNYAGGHVAYSGTSMATPHVAGAAALLIQYTRLAYGRTPTPAMLEHLLKSSGTPATDTAFSNLTKPRINVLAATRLKGDVPTTPGALPFWTPSTNPASCTLNENESCTVNWTVNATTTNGTYEFFVIVENNYSYGESNRFNASLVQAPSVAVSITLSNTTVYTNESAAAQITLTAYDALNRTNVTLTVTLTNFNATNSTVTADNATETVLAWTLNLTNETAFMTNLTLTPLTSGNATINASAVWNNSTIASVTSTVLVVAPDLTAPNLTSLSASSIGKTTATLTLITDETATCSYSTTDVVRENMTVFSVTNATTHTVALSSLTAATQYTYFARCIDSSLNENNDSINTTFTTTAASSGGGGGGRKKGGGGAARAPDTAVASERSWQLETTQGEQTLRIARTDIALQSITFTTDERIQALVRVAVAQQVPVVKKHTYQYIVVEHPDALAPQDISIEFSVPRAWLEQQALASDSVQLFRFENDAWTPLDTVVERETDLTVYYTARSPGLSLYAISTREAPLASAPPAVQAMPAPVVAEELAPRAPVAVQRTDSPVFVWLVFVALGAGAGTVYLVYNKGRKGKN